MSGILDILKVIYKTIAGFGALMVGLLFFIVLLMAIGLGGQEKPAPTVADGTVLLLAPTGQLVEQTQLPDPLDYLYDDFRSRPVESSFHDVISAIEHAADDERIAALAIYTDHFAGASLAHLHEIADSIRQFKESKKPVYALSLGYSQSDYLLAAEADEIYMNPVGTVTLNGFRMENTYYSGLLEKLGASVNVFRVGTYKSAVEPYLRDNMSPEARAASKELLTRLWNNYADRIAEARGLDRGAIEDTLADLPAALRDAGGDMAELALQQGLVDTLAPRAEWRQKLMETHGATPDGDSFKQIDYKNYLAAVKKPKGAANKIAIVMVQGPIVMGEGPVDVAAAETIVRHIRRARSDDDVKAIVLRVDSPGGSAFASELIRQELVAAQADGKPVVASFANVAASGGYWISATADEIWSSANTITGSIGIFAVLPTFENTIAKAGIYTDGVGTSPVAGPISITSALKEPVKDILQQSIEDGYEDFLSLVASGRGMTIEDVDKIAQGRVWDGAKAYELGLVDKLGTLDEAVDAAAHQAGVDDYEGIIYREGLNKLDTLLVGLLGNSTVRESFIGDVLGLKGQAALPTTPIMREFEKLKQDLGRIMQFNDPNNSYILCLTCTVR